MERERLLKEGDGAEIVRIDRVPSATRKGGRG